VAPAGKAIAREDVIMLVTFSCPAYASITMFGDVAIRLLKLMGHSGTVPSALLAEDVQAALKRLEAAVETVKQSPEPEEPAEGENGEPAVSLPHRALPLFELLKAAAKAKCDVMWDKKTNSAAACDSHSNSRTPIAVGWLGRNADAAQKFRHRR
jgi:Domain of unknown function (DUF1840)